MYVITTYYEIDRNKGKKMKNYKPKIQYVRLKVTTFSDEYGHQMARGEIDDSEAVQSGIAFLAKDFGLPKSAITPMMSHVFKEKLLKEKIPVIERELLMHYIPFSK